MKTRDYATQVLFLFFLLLQLTEVCCSISSVESSAGIHEPERLRDYRTNVHFLQGHHAVVGVKTVQGQLRPERALSADRLVEREKPTPLLLKPWVKLSGALPVSFTLVSALFFTLLDYALSFVFHKASGWPFLECRSVAGSFATIFHSTVLVTGLGACLLQADHYRPSGRMSDHPSWWREAATALIQFCTGYMIYDSCIQFMIDRWVPGKGLVHSATDYMFLGHHAVTTFYMTTARCIGAGHMR